MSNLKFVMKLAAFGFYFIFIVFFSTNAIFGDRIVRTKSVNKVVLNETLRALRDFSLKNKIQCRCIDTEPISIEGCHIWIGFCFYFAGHRDGNI